MTIFAERLKQLRKSKALTQKEVAEQLGMTQQNYQKWESGKSSPSGETLDKLADYFQVSTDYLLGRTKEEVFRGKLPKLQMAEEIDFTERLKRLRKGRNLRQVDIAEKLGIKQVAYGRIELGIVKPKVKHLRVLSEFYNVSIDDLLGSAILEKDNEFLSQKDIFLSQLEEIEQISNEIIQKQQILENKIQALKKEIL
ncbi:helix-turn-helix domain-containing protein [Lactococcus protaetiae]|uniref:Helix-turn-helix transcriptional regulator n=1 Tax=Lactococcus protaetiae TaxID=2592653 RepID=A0A514Z6D6_9LACT|nr:helix-turn-helix transcriptional regulator [Lactococcus protaetiae]QDK70154.1 helix-turn-helix transcriptional regulator [Lactococcus protaetiae]